MSDQKTSDRNQAPQTAPREFRQDIRGRGASQNTLNRFDKSYFEAEEQDWDNYLFDEEGRPKLTTQFLKDSSRTVVNENSSPDIGFSFSINPYRGCEHGCAYCYARPTHEYLGHSAGLDFESKIYVKEDAAELLRAKLLSKSWQPQTIAMSGVTDCYQPIERKLKITRSCLEVLLQFKNPVALITKNSLIARDIDLFQEMTKYRGVGVFVSVTTLDAQLGADLEPRTSRPEARLATIRKLSEAGIPVGVNVAPVIPGLTDHEMPAILKACREAGANFAGFTPVRLPLAVLPIFSEWLEVHRPDRKSRILEKIKALRGGKLNDARFGTRMTGEGPVAEQMKQMFQIYSRREGFNQERLALSAESFQIPPQTGDQMSLF